jgi:hypothetical protein
MKEAKHEAFSSPIYDNIHGHVVFVQGDFFSFGPRMLRAIVT